MVFTGTITKNQQKHPFCSYLASHDVDWYLEALNGTFVSKEVIL